MGLVPKPAVSKAHPNGSMHMINDPSLHFQSIQHHQGNDDFMQLNQNSALGHKADEHQAVYEYQWKKHPQYPH